MSGFEDLCALLYFQRLVVGTQLEVRVGCDKAAEAWAVCQYESWAWGVCGGIAWVAKEWGSG